MSKEWRVIAAAVLSLQLWAHPTAAEVISLDGRAMTIEPIAGYCALDKANSVENRVYSFVEKAVSAQSRLLGYWVDCDVLQNFRAGTSTGLIPYILVMANMKHDRIFETTLPRQELLDRTYAELKEAFGSQEFLTEVNDKTRTQVNQAIQDFAAGAEGRVQVGGTKFMGVMERDPEAIYFALVQHVSVDQEETIMAGVTGITKVKRFSLNAAAYDIYADERTFFTLRERAATAIHSLIAANPAGE